MTKIEEIEQKLNEMNEGLEVGIKKFQEQITDFNNELRIAKEDFLDELNECQKALAELKESKKEKWKPKYGDTYWLRDTIGKFGVSEYCAGDCIEWRLNNIPLFKTREECERYWHFMDTVKEKSYSFSKEEWGDHNLAKYFIAYDWGNKNFIIINAYLEIYLGKIYFARRSDAQYIIDNFKEELMEYWI